MHQKLKEIGHFAVCSEFVGHIHLLLINSVFSPGRGLAAFMQEKLRWCKFKAKKMHPLRCSAGASLKSQIDFRTLSSLNCQPTFWYLACLNKMNKKHDIKRFKLFNFILPLFLLVPHMWQRLVNVCNS